ncbi:MAG: glycoside hydrolase family 127 protein [Dysgonomonas sp.]
MNKSVFSYLFLIVALLNVSATVKSQQMKVKSSVANALEIGNPSEIKIHNYLGDRIDACIQEQVKAMDVSYLVNPFYNKTETHRWQSEFWGKWMLAAVLSYQYTRDPILMDSIRSGVNKLLDSQLANGYIGNYSPEAQLQQWDVWGRKYSMLGLLAYYDLTGDKKTLKACQRMADHLMTQVGPGKVNIVTTGNYRGMASSSILEPIIFLYKRTNDKRYLDFARYIVNEWETESGPQLISKAESGIPVGDRFPHPVKLQKSWFSPENGQKAYEMMSCYEGLLELYKITGKEQYLLAVEKTVRNIIDMEINIAGSGSAFECWYHGKELQTRPTYHTMETCVTMTWMKLCQTLLSLTGNPLYADQIEKTAYNALLASMKDDASQIAKYSPLEGQRHAGEDQCDMHINCCIANGPRAFVLLPQYAIMKAEGNDVYLNLYTDLSADIQMSSKKTLKVVQKTNYPADGSIDISMNTDQPDSFTLALRIPSWSSVNSVTVNGEKQEGVAAGTYYRINRVWSKGDKVVLNLDTRGRIKRQNGYAAIEKGPLVLARDTRFDDGFIDETAQIQAKDGYVELISVVDPPQGIWMAFTAPLVLGTDLEGEARRPKQIRFCDFSSAGNTWSADVRYRIWIPETLNVMQTEYMPY